MIRKPAVAGQFYPDNEPALRKAVEALVDPKSKKEDAIGAISPHAGYVYSGDVAGSVLSLIKPKPTYIILGPNHTGLGASFSLATQDAWTTPLGDVEINRTLAGCIKKNCKYIKEDAQAHMYEHSIEVQLPFLQVLKKRFTFVPIAISHSDAAVYTDVGKCIAKAVKQSGLEKEVTIIASSDMTHYEERDSAEEKDKKAIDAILKLDEKALVAAVEKFGISMCGYAPAAVMLSAAKELGAKSGRLIKYRTSGDSTGDYSSVVGYAGVIIT